MNEETNWSEYENFEDYFPAIKAILDEFKHDGEELDSKLREVGNPPAFNFCVNKGLIEHSRSSLLRKSDGIHQDQVWYTITLFGKTIKGKTVPKYVEELRQQEILNRQERKLQSDLVQASKDAAKAARKSLWVSGGVSLITVGVLVYQSTNTQKIEITQPIPPSPQLEQQIIEVNTSVSRLHLSVESFREELQKVSTKSDSASP